MVNLEDAVTARLEYYGEHFEILVDPDLASDYKGGKKLMLKIFLQWKKFSRTLRKGDKASEEAMMEAFNTF